nr:Phage-like element PbsX protein XkdW [uncultured Mediterranean phage uvMED]
MAQLSTKIEMYCTANGVASVDFMKDVMLQDDSDGKGAYIKEWNLGIAKPTDDQLASYDADADKQEQNNQIRATRKAEYGDIGDQLDEIYKDIDAWKTRIAKVKADNPKV